MSKLRCIVCLLAFFLVISIVESHAVPTLSIGELIEKNVEAAGGMEQLSSIKNYTFRLGPQVVHSLRDGRLKISTGRPPAITGVTLVDGSLVKSNILNQITEPQGQTKATYQAMARLYGGLFTLMGFKEILKLEGLKRFGPETHYKASARLDEFKIDFYLDSNDFTIKRLAFQGYDPDSGKYEVNYDFGPYQTIGSIRIPGSWFNSQVGIRGEANQVEDVTLNPSLDEERFSRLEINTGSVKIENGVLCGNITDFGLYQKNMLNITTNWNDGWVKKAGFKSGETLVLQMAGKTIELVIYDSLPPGTAFGPGAKLLFRSPEADIYVIFFVPPAGQGLDEKLKPLLPIKVKRTI